MKQEMKVHMKLTLPQRLQAFRDITRKNQFEIKKFILNDGKKHPFAVICPGGGYSAVCSFVEGKPFAKKLNKMGYSAFVVYYRVREEAHFPAPQDDLARAVQEILAHAQEWNLETEGYSVWGSSAGGHLAGTFGTEALGYVKYGLPKPGAMVLVYPVVTMTMATHGGSRENLLGAEPTEEMIRLCSVEQQVTENYPPTFVWCGDADQTVNPENSRMLERALLEKGVPCQRKEYPGVDHGVGLGKGTSSEGWIEDAVAFWEKHRK